MRKMEKKHGGFSVLHFKWRRKNRLENFFHLKRERRRLTRIASDIIVYGSIKAFIKAAHTFLVASKTGLEACRKVLSFPNLIFGSHAQDSQSHKHKDNC